MPQELRWVVTLVEERMASRSIAVQEGSSLRSISDIARHQRLKDNNDEGIAPKEMLQELRADNLQLMRFLRPRMKFAIATMMSDQGCPQARARPKRVSFWLNQSHPQTIEAVLDSAASASLRRDAFSRFEALGAA